MLTLYYSPGACSLAPHIALCENNVKFNLKKVDLATKKVADDSDFNKINPKSYVPTLQLENGEVLTECATILFYITEQFGPTLPVGNSESFDRYRLQEALTFISSELHKGVSNFFNPELEGAYRDKILAKIKKRLDFLEKQLNKNEYLTGDIFTVADAYCFTILRWVNAAMDIGVKTTDWPKLDAYYKKIAQRPKVQQALQEEGVKKW